MTSFYTILISAGVSLLTALGTFQTRIWGDTLLLRRQHEWEQRKDLQKLVSRYHARLLEAALDWDRRMQQAYAGECRWLTFEHPSQIRNRDQYFFHSMVYRFLALLTTARQFEKEAFFIDARISDKHKELDFLRYAKSFIWALTSSDLTPQDGMPGRDHFPNDVFRALLDRCVPASGATEDVLFDWDRYWSTIVDAAGIPRPRESGENGDQPPRDDTGHGEETEYARSLLSFFEGMRPNEATEEGHEPRRRWDRLVCLHLLVLGFIATFGYRWQQDVSRSVEAAVKEFRADGVAAAAFLEGGSRHLGLGAQQPFQRLCRAVTQEWPDAIESAREIKDLRERIAAIETEAWRCSGRTDTTVTVGATATTVGENGVDDELAALRGQVRGLLAASEDRARSVGAIR